jgi:hypothetical protein
MTAGRGIVHSERTADVPRANGQRLHGLQVWVALPEEYEETAPEFYHYEESELPEIKQDGVTMRLIAGSAYSRVSPVKTFSPLFYLDVHMPAASTIHVPEEYAERAIHVVSGQVRIKERRIAPFNMAICREAERVEITAMQESRLALFGGVPITDRFLWWNFVSSSKSRIEQAKHDWENDRFGRVPGETEFIPLPEDR